MIRTLQGAAESAALSLDETREITGCSKTALYEEISAGRLKARKLGRRTLIFRADLMEWLNALPAKSGKSLVHRNAAEKRWAK